jgi:N-acetylglucosaminyldiphosphoundecaprenol N-acetyl-beta-D-mannosaminyltransferase
MPQFRYILNVRVDATTYAGATRSVLDWARQRRSCYVCLGVVSHIMEAQGSPEFQNVLHHAALVTSDGMPLVWLLRWLGIPSATRVYGPDLTPHVLAAAARDGIPVGFYGGTPEVLARLTAILQQRFPTLRIAYASAPPFRPLTPQENEATVRAINASGARILFVGLGSPKQDRWMFEHHGMFAHQGRIDAVMLGVGAAFDFLSGAKAQAPVWMRRSGLEWLFRLVHEPRRLGPRYLTQNPRFLFLALAELLRSRSLDSNL